MEFIIKDLECISQYQYLSSNKRFITKRGKAWMKSYQEQLTKQMEEKNYTILDSDNIEVELTMTFCNKRKNDIDNGLHYILDGMEGLVMTNDRYITRLVAEKNYCKKYEGMTNVVIRVSDRNNTDDDIKIMKYKDKAFQEKYGELIEEFLAS